METTEEEHEQAIVTSTSSVPSIDESLDQFLEKNENERSLTPDLDQLLTQIAKTGCFSHPWEKIKPVFLYKLVRVLDDFNGESPMDKLESHPNVDASTFDELKCDLIERIDTFENAPFTIQRLCELITSPRNHYRRTDKFLRGLTKCVSVVTTIDNEGNKIYVEPSRVIIPSLNAMAPPTSIPTSMMITNGFILAHEINDSDNNNSHEIESQETQADSSTGNTQLDEEMEQDEEDEDDEDEENETSPAPVVDESSSSSNSNSTPIPSSSSTEDMLEQ